MPTLVPRALAERMTLTLAVCLTAAVVAGVGLFLPRLSPLSHDEASGGPAEETPAIAGATPSIQMVDFAFAGDFTVAPGASIDVTNVDVAPHTITSNDGEFDTGTLEAGATGTLIAPSQPGTYAFICTIHPFMAATLTVQP